MPLLASGDASHVISGTACKSEAVIQSAANVTWALCKTGTTAKLCYCLPESNSLGLAMLGGKSLEDAFSVVKDGTADTILILENDLYRTGRYPTSGCISQDRFDGDPPR